MSEKYPINYIQTVLTNEENDEVNLYLAKARIRNKREWVKDLIMKEVKNSGNALRLHEGVPSSEGNVGGTSYE